MRDYLSTECVSGSHCTSKTILGLKDKVVQVLLYILTLVYTYFLVAHIPNNLYFIVKSKCKL